MKEKYRVRSGRIVQFETPTIYELDETGSTVVDIDGMQVGFEIDTLETEIPDYVDYSLVLGVTDVERLLSGFPARYINVLDGEDLIIMFEHRIDGEWIVEDRLGDLVTFDEFLDEAPGTAGSEFSLDEVPDSLPNEKTRDHTKSDIDEAVSEIDPDNVDTRDTKTLGELLDGE